MTNEEILKAREKYNKLLEERKIIIAAKDILSKLEKNEDVQKYKDLLNIFFDYDEECFRERIDKKIECEIPKTKENYVHEAFNSIACSTVNSNNIYVFCGCYTINDKGYFERVPLDYDLNKCVRYYYELEKMDCEWHDYRFDEKFLNEHTVIFPPGINDLQPFQNFRNNFFEQLLDNPQEEVVQKILSQYKRKN